MTSQRGIAPLIIVAIVAVLAVVGIGGYAVMKNAPANSTNSQGNTPASQGQANNGNGVIGSIQEALQKSLSLQCDYTDASGRKSVTYIKAGAIRSDFNGSNGDESGVMLMKDGKAYIWNTVKKEGVTMEFDMAQMGRNMKENTQIPGQNPADFVKELEQYKQYCHTATVADSLFVVPTDVKFTDLTSMMKDVQKMMPSGIINPTGAAAMQDKMKNFQNKYQMPQGAPANQ